MLFAYEEKEGPYRKVILLDSRHCTGCSTGGGIHFRHDLVKRVIFDEAQEASLQPRLEVPNVPGSQSPPADVFIPKRHNGIAAALDVCIVAPSHARKNSEFLVLSSSNFRAIFTD
jgi:hypothetical protein